MKVVAFNGSPRKDGNTAILIRHVFIELEQEGIETELVQLAGKPLRGCLACYKCWVNADQQCVQKGDELNEYVQKMVRADGIVLGSPVYVSSVPAEMKALIDRAGLVARVNGDLLKRKVGAAVVAARGLGHGLRRDQPLLPDRADDRARLHLLEHGHRDEQGRRGGRRRGRVDDEDAWREHRLAAEGAARLI